MPERNGTNGDRHRFREIDRIDKRVDKAHARLTSTERTVRRLERMIWLLIAGVAATQGGDVFRLLMAASG